MENKVADKSLLFAIRIVKLYRLLINEKKNLSYQNNY